MDEHPDVVTVTSVSESTGIVAVPSGDETLTEHVGCEGQIEGSFNGGEVMVEVVGSDVFVDGVAGHGSGDLTDEAGGDGLGKEGLEREIKALDGGGGGLIGDLMSREVVDLGGQIWDGSSSTETGIQGFRKIAAESLCERGHDVVEEVKVIAGSSSEQIQAVSMEKVVMPVTEDRGLVEEGSRRGMQSFDGMGGTLGDLTSQKVGVLDDVWNPGIETVVAESSFVETQVTGEKTDLVVKEEGLNQEDVFSGTDVVQVSFSGKDHSSKVEMDSVVSDEDGNTHAKDELWDQQANVDVGGEVGEIKMEEILHSKVEVTKTDISGQKLLYSVEAQQIEVEPASEGAVSHDNMGVDSLSSCEPAKYAGDGEVAEVNDKVSSGPDVEALKNVGLSGTDGNITEVGDLSSASGSSVEQTQVAAGSVVIDRMVSASGSGAQVSGGGKCLNTENGVVGAFYNSLNFVDNQELRIKTMNENSKIGVSICAEPESSRVQTLVVNEVIEMDGKVSSPKLEVQTIDDKNGIVLCSQDFQNIKCETSETAHTDGIIPSCPESLMEQACVAEGGEVEAMDSEEVLNFKDEVPEIDALDGNARCSETDQSLEVDGSSENDVAGGHMESFCEPTQIADGADIVAVAKDEVPKCEAEADTYGDQAILDYLKLDSSNVNLYLSEVDENSRAAPISGSTVNGGFSQADSGSSKNHILVAGGETKVMADKNVSNPQLEVLDGETCLQKDEELMTQPVGRNTEKEDVAQENASSSGEHSNIEIQGESSVPECHGNVEVPSYALAGNLSLSANDGSLKVETSDSSTIEVGFRGKDPSVGSQVGDHHASTPKTDAVSPEGNTSMQDERQEAVSQLVETPTPEVDRDESKNPPSVHEISNEVSGAVTGFTAGSQVAVNCASHGEVDTISSSEFPSENLNPEVHVISNGTCLLDGEQTMGSFVPDVVVSNEVPNQVIETKSGSCKTDHGHIRHIHVPEAKVFNLGLEVEVDDKYPDGERVDSHKEQEIEIEEQTTGSDQSNDSKQKILKPENFLRGHQSSYLPPPENEGEYSVSDLVWGKVRSHPWWPGQIFDPADVSEKAIKYHKKDCFLVAYFGDRTFAWNDASLLKPFRSHFSQIEKQNNSEAFHNAVNCALEEVSRRVELGLACSCIPKDAYDNVESQIVENTGIRQESSRRFGVDKSTGPSSFKPDKLVEYIRALAESPSDSIDRLELVISKAQLSAFCHFKGYEQLPEIQFCGGLLENDADTSQWSEVIEDATYAIEDGEHILSSKEKLKSENGSSHKRKHNLKDSVYPSKKEKSLTELMGDTAHSSDEDGLDGKVAIKSVSSSSGNKRKAVDSITDGSDRRISIYAAKVSTTVSSIPKPSFKVGECIRRVASQLTGSPSIVKCNSNQSGHDGLPHTPENSLGVRMIDPTEYPSIDDMLSQLHLAARDPMGGYNFLNTVVTFFSGFRNSIVMSQHSGRHNSSTGRIGGGRKKKATRAVIGLPEEFEFDDVNDSYWTDMIVQNYSEEQLLANCVNGEGEYQLVAFEPDKSRHRSHSRKRYSSANHELAAEPTEFVDDRRHDLPAELILNFSEGDSVPSEINLNKIFRRFGPLKESETEVVRETGCARVVYKRGSDAEIAFSSAAKFNIFGPMLVNYRLSYSSSISFRTLPLALSQREADTT